MKFFVIFLLQLTLIASKSYSSERTDSIWNQLLDKYDFPSSDQSYCYTDQQGLIQGENIETKVRLASVTKLLTSLWAIERLGIDFKYETKLYLKDGNLHIAGSVDPFLGNEKMFFLLSQLNDLGIRKFDTVTFDKYIQIFPKAQDYTDEYPLITRATNAQNLKMYFNTKSWSSELKAEYVRIAGLHPNRFRKSVQFEMGMAQYVDRNPYEFDRDAKILTLSSPALYKYLKEINVQSNNYAAQTIFLRLGGADAMEKFLSDRFNKTLDSIYLYTGSGLPLIKNGERMDNYANCQIMVELISALKTSVINKGRALKDVLAVPGSDAGTFANRPFPDQYKNSFLAKTGTLMHTSTLAGAMSTRDGLSFYGIFNQTTDITRSKVIQNEMINSIFSEMGGPRAFNYVVIPFETYSSVYSKFLPVEENLY